MKLYRVRNGWADLEQGVLVIAATPERAKAQAQKHLIEHGPPWPETLKTSPEWADPATFTLSVLCKDTTQEWAEE